jgi:hypothetical protein
MIYLSFNASEKFVLKDDKWIATLSDGSTVFEDKIPGEKSAWRRLQEYVKLNNLKIENLRLETYGRRVLLIPYRDVSNNPQINGYWYTNKVNTMFMPGYQLESIWRGIGYVKGKKIYCTWVLPNGEVLYEERKYDNSEIIASIINDEV